jgi:endonuclease/exonuclease/phosphatase family metal-dependent hydrolase
LLSGAPLAPAAAPCRLAVASYNVHRCIGADGRHDPRRVGDVLGELDADLIGLQEVASRFDGDGAIDQLAYLARATGLEAIAGPTLHHGRGHCGNALLTRRPVLAVERIDLSLPGREPRGALDVTLALGTESVRVIVTHLGLRWRDRRTQVRRLLEVLAEDEGFVVLLGDINEWLPRGGCLGRLHARLGHAAAVRTFPARRPVFALDRIWVQPRAALTALVAHASPLARRASDHLPVRGAIEWIPTPEPA